MLFKSFSVISKWDTSNWNPLISSVLSMMAQIELKPGKPQIKKDEYARGDVSGIIGMVGPQVKGSFSISFEEGSTINIIEVKSSSSIQILDDSRLLAQTFSTKNPIAYNYRLISADKDTINILKKSIEENKNIESIEIRYVT